MPRKSSRSRRPVDADAPIRAIIYPRLSKEKAGPGNTEASLNTQRASCERAIAAHGLVLTPGRYVGVDEGEEDDEPFADKMTRLTSVLDAQFAESARLEGVIRGISGAGVCRLTTAPPA